MTNYGRDPLENLANLWKEILELHWNYLEIDESLKKIDERKKLEGRLREYISIVPHDRKFFLPETEHVLRASIVHMKDFSAFKGAIGFESISQYANNLFMKPWRKEYRVIKMYSGFYQHEIRNNLLDAERIFIAMGYKLLPNQTLVLDGPICPDQVTNVSRDALTAYVECQIMKQVNSELTSLGLQTTWNEIFNFRECHIGDSSQTIKGLTQIIQSHMHNMQMRKDPYASHYQQQLCSSHCSMHSYNNQAIPPPPPPLAPQQNPYYHYAQPCTLHSSQNNYIPPPPASASSSSVAPLISNNCFQQQQQNHLPHSKSLDQYDAANKMHSNGVNHRLSLDSHNYKSTSPHNLSPSQHQHQHMQVNQSFDFIDAAYNHHPYNQPNVRAPLPFNLSSNLGSHFSTSASGHHEQNNAGYYTSVNEHHNHHQHQQQMRNENYYQQPIMQLPTPVNDFCQQHSPSHNDMNMKPQTELKLRSSLKKNTHSTSDSLDMEHELNELRALKREKSSTPASTSSEMKTRDGIGNYQTWDYVFQNLEKDMEKKKSITADEKIAAELESLKVTANGHGPPKDRDRGDRHSKSNNNGKASSSHSHNNVSSQTKMRTKSVSVSTSTDLPPLQSSHEHKRTSSVSTENNHKIQMKKPPELIVGEDEWSCRFCTFLNPNTKKICEMCSKSKDFFFSDAGKSSSATCV